MKKKLVSLLACIMVIALVFAGCGGRGGDSNVDPTEAPDTNNEDWSVLIKLDMQLR